MTMAVTTERLQARAVRVVETTSHESGANLRGHSGWLDV